ncbi:MAG: hypothetical protein IID30_14990 [Planctomycetes bacterium]|nr:hypothetical protein [Planctomycetota bacterium]
MHDTVSWCTTFGQDYYILVHGNIVSGDPFVSEGFFILDVTTDATSCATALSCGVPRPFNDKCADAFVLVPGELEETPPGSGIFVSTVNTPTIPDSEPRHNNINALTDGPVPAPGCTFITQDVWYTYKPNFTSSVVLDTCFFLGSPVNVDTAIEIYLAASADCPPVDVTGFVECQNNSAGCPGGSQFTTPIIVFAGQEILIRLGANGGDKEGFYTLRVAATALESQCPDPLLWDPCPAGGVREGGGNGELLLASPPYTTLDISAVTGAFAVGDEVTGAASTETGDIIALQTIGGVDILMLDNVSGAFTLGETITVGDPLDPGFPDASATADAVTNFVDTGDITNGGCNMCAPGQLFETLVLDLATDTDPDPEDKVICGQISTYVADADLDCDAGLDGFAYQLRDTDWYEIVVPSFIDELNIPRLAELTITFTSEFSGSFGFTDNVCGATPGDVVPFVASGLNGGLCTDVEFTANLEGGTYYFVVTAFSLSGIEVGGTHEGHDYVLKLAPIAMGPPFPTVNNECVDAISVLANSTTVADQRGGANQNTSDVTGFGCPFVAASRHFASIWYKFVATETTAEVNTCTIYEFNGFTGGEDSSLMVFSAAEPVNPCSNLVLADCSEDSCAPFLSNTRSFATVIGESYYISLGAWNVGEIDVYNLDVISPAP